MQSLRVPRKGWRGPRAGQIKMKGKKIKYMECGCCVCKDFRDKVTEKYFDKQISTIYIN